MRFFVALALILSLSGCMTLSEKDRLDSARAIADPAFADAKVYVKHKDEALAGLFSFLGPGLGHLYLEEPGWAGAWALLGVVAPFASIPASVADCRVKNDEYLARAYRAWLARRTGGR